MSWGAVAGAAVVTVGGMVAANQKTQAAKGAANAQKEGTKDALEEEQRQFDIQWDEYQRNQALLEQQNEQIRQNLAPYVQAGQGALFEMMALSGVAIPSQPTVPQNVTPKAGSIIDSRKLIAPKAPTEPGKMGIMGGTSTGAAGPMSMLRGPVAGAVQKSVVDAFEQAEPPPPVMPAPDSPYAGMTGEQAQETAIDRIAQSPLLAELTRQGEEAILQNAAATGGLRGGNTQAALAEFRPQMLQNEIDKQFARLAGIGGMGQQAINQAPTQVARGAPTTNTADYMARIGDINAQRLLTEAEAGGEMWGSIGKGAGTALGAYLERDKK